MRIFKEKIKYRLENGKEKERKKGKRGHKGIQKKKKKKKKVIYIVFKCKNKNRPQFEKLTKLRIQMLCD